MSPIRYRENPLIYVGTIAAILISILLIFPDSWIFRYPTKIPSVRAIYNFTAISLLFVWFIVAIHYRWTSGFVRSLILGLLGGYLAYFPAAVVAEAHFFAAELDLLVEVLA